MRIAVLGAGAIGSYVGASLARGGADVALVARGPHLEALRREGVRIMSPRGDFDARPFATDDPREIGEVDFVFLGLKAYSYATASELLSPLLGPETSVIAAQNGVPWWYFHGLTGQFRDRRIEAVDPGGAVSSAIAPPRAIGCVVYSSTTIERPGTIVHLEGTRFTIGEPSGVRSARCLRFSEAMIAGGLKCPVVENIRDEIWIKLMGNVAFNPLSILTRATLAAMCRNTGTRALVAEMMGETLAIAGALGSHPEISIDRRINGAERVGDHKTSTLQDLEDGKQLELDAIIGAVVELADLTGQRAPALRAVYAASSLLAETAGLAAIDA